MFRMLPMCYNMMNIAVELTTLAVSFVFIIEQGVSNLSLYVILFVSTEAAIQRCS